MCDLFKMCHTEWRSTVNVRVASTPSKAASTSTCTLPEIKKKLATDVPFPDVKVSQKGSRVELSQPGGKIIFIFIMFSLNYSGVY
jgi:hypothetical protein